jgi:hypothetical protein
MALLATLMHYSLANSQTLACVILRRRRLRSTFAVYRPDLDRPRMTATRKSAKPQVDLTRRFCTTACSRRRLRGICTSASARLISRGAGRVLLRCQLSSPAAPLATPPRLRRQNEHLSFASNRLTSDVGANTSGARCRRRAYNADQSGSDRRASDGRLSVRLSASRERVPVRAAHGRFLAARRLPLLAFFPPS